jgi:hypothetical protein
VSDNINVKDASGTTVAMQTKDNTTFHTPKHCIVRDDGTVPLQPRAEDEASGSGHAGLPILAVQLATPADTAGTDADYSFLQMSAGRLWCSSIITAIVPGSGATNLGKAEDAAHSSGDIGVMALAVRQDTAAALGGTDGDYMPPIVDATGRLWVHCSALEPGTAATSLGKAEDAAHTSGDVGVMSLGVRNDTHTTGLSGTDGDYTPIQVDASGKVGIRGTFAEDAAHTSGDLGHFVLAVANSTHTTGLSGTDGDYTPIAVDLTGKVGIRGTFAEDAAHTTADLGVHILGVRNDADANRTSTDADYGSIALDIAGRAKVNVVEERTILDVTPVCDTSAYASGDTLFDRITCGTVARRNGDTVVLESVIILDVDDQAAAEMDLYFLDSDVTLGTANAAPSISDANAAKIVGHLNIPSSAFKDLGGCKIACMRGVDLSMKTDAASQILYVAGVTQGTPTQTAGGIKLKLSFRRG